MIKSAESAAPAAVSSSATIYAMDDKGAMRTLREGTNDWWCMPDGSVSPGIDPMCGDANTMEWLMAMIEKKEPPEGKIGFILHADGRFGLEATPIPLRWSPRQAMSGSRLGRMS